MPDEIQNSIIDNETMLGELLEEMEDPDMSLERINEIRAKIRGILITLDMLEGGVYQDERY